MGLAAVSQDKDINDRWRAVVCESCGDGDDLYECSECIVIFCDGCLSEHDEIHAEEDDDRGDGESEDMTGAHQMADSDALARWREGARGWHQA